MPSCRSSSAAKALSTDYAERAREATDLRIRNARIEHPAIVSERQHIARDLHHVVGHSLTAVVVRAQLIGAGPSRAEEEAAEIVRSACDALTHPRHRRDGFGEPGSFHS
ncbi:histidine kinase [Amycolatopsis sp.]|uniref:histidine kinase n=1 Tax=Amycolatopsis sp. TaxID=37632 RepID=UPI002C0D896A|nr:histidine kinase [Amycolatopsis sp.]HVV08985.1 histidine kinase [Amycolatopsis sp.]